ncbi:MAG: cobalamin-dependent protein [Dehalococcoidia bacterium]|nr:MAG: cobalamin-dependent protein [Dehalococcoidia bacterium]
MRTLLVNPPYAFSEIPILPMGISYIAGILEHYGHEVQILDLLVSRYSREKIVRKIEEYQPDIVGVTSVTMNYPIASEILKHCKSVDKDITTVIGGPHVTFSAVETLNEAPWIDIVVRGEGEQTILDILGGVKPADTKGIAYRSDGEIVITDGRSLIENLDEIPLPAKHLFPLSRYVALDVHASVVAGRGCPFNCIFCVGSKMGGRRARYRNPRLVVDEIEQALTYGFKEVNFEDDLLTLNHKHVYAVCDEIIQRGLKFNWSVFARVDTVNLELLRRMREAGCNWMLYGVESGNQQILNTVRKKVTLDQIREGVRLGKEAGINIMASFIIGLPGETVETMKETIEFALELETTWGFNVLSPFPGTEVREKADEYGIRILTDDWTQYDANTPVSRTEAAGPAEIAAALSRYNEGLMQYLADLTKEGKIDPAEAIHSKMRSPLAWTLLHGDIIEDLGPVESNDDPVDSLVDRLEGIVSYTREQIKENIAKWVEEGLLKYELQEGDLIWRWG